METQWAVSRAPASRQDSRRSTSTISDSSSRWPRQTAACAASTAATRSSSEWKWFLPRLAPTAPGGERKALYRTHVRLSRPRCSLSPIPAPYVGAGSDLRDRAVHTSHSDNDLSSSMSLLPIAHGLGDLAE